MLELSEVEDVPPQGRVDDRELLKCGKFCPQIRGNFVQMAADEGQFRLRGVGCENFASEAKSWGLGIANEVRWGGRGSDSEDESEQPNDRPRKKN